MRTVAADLGLPDSITLSTKLHGRYIEIMRRLRGLGLIEVIIKDLILKLILKLINFNFI